MDESACMNEGQAFDDVDCNSWDLREGKIGPFGRQELSEISFIHIFGNDRKRRIDGRGTHH